MNNTVRARRFLGVFAAALVVALAVSAAPASAKPDPDREKIGQIGAGVGNSATAAEIICEVYSAPSPQYSSAGGPWGTVHYGAQIVCRSVGELTLTVYLYSIHGNGDNEYKEFEDSFAKYKVGWDLGYSEPVACIGNGSTRWILAAYASWNGQNTQPYPGWSSVKTLPCGSG